MPDPRSLYKFHPLCFIQSVDLVISFFGEHIHVNWMGFKGDARDGNLGFPSSVANAIATCLLFYLQVNAQVNCEGASLQILHSV
jgi:hypothetical protein